MDSVAVRPVDPAELPALVAEAVEIADAADLSDGDRTLLLPAIFGVLTARAVFPAMQQVTPARALGALDAFRGPR